MRRWFLNQRRWSRIAETILGGIFLALLFFFFNDVCFGLPSLDGKWTVHGDVIQSKKWQGYRSDFIVLIQQSGESVKGSAEKISETDPDGKVLRYDIEKRVQATFTGYITKKFFGRNRLVVHWDEKGRKMTLEEIQIMKILNDDHIEGTFATTRGEHSGKITWTKL